MQNQAFSNFELRLLISERGYLMFISINVESSTTKVFKPQWISFYPPLGFNSNNKFYIIFNSLFFALIF